MGTLIINAVGKDYIFCLAIQYLVYFFKKCDKILPNLDKSVEKTHNINYYISGLYQKIKKEKRKWINFSKSQNAALP